VAASISAIPNTTATVTTLPRKRAALNAVGRTIHGSARLSGPPVSTTAIARTLWIRTMLAAMCSWGRAERAQRVSNVNELAAAMRKRTAIHQP
jgi:hypothetical protein